MIRLFFIAILTFSVSLSDTQNVSLLNSIKKVVQKEEYIALAINKYIIENAQLPQTKGVDTDKVLDWDKFPLEYLGTNFNIKNSYTSNDMYVYFIDGFAFIKGVIDSNETVNNKKFIYNYYIDQVNRVNTIPPKDTSETALKKGSQIVYSNLQKQIVNALNEGSSIKKTSLCTAQEYFYEIVNNNLEYKYCYENSKSFNVNNDDGKNIIVEDINHLAVIEAPIGTRAFVKAIDGTWNDYYYKSSDNKWTQRILSPVTGTGLDGNTGSGVSGENPIATVPGDKILVLRKDVGCMLVGGDISCWGDNSYNKFGVDTTSNPNSDYLLTPVMLRSQLEDISSTKVKSILDLLIEIVDVDTDLLSGLDNVLTNLFGSIFGGSSTSYTAKEDWNNSINRVKYKAVAVNNQDVCGVSENNELYCSGKFSNSTYLKKMRSNTQSVAMTDIAIAIVDTNGTLYTKGVNLNGILGIDDSDYTEKSATFLDLGLTTKFSEVYSLTSSRTFGAIDENNSLWIWGQRESSDLLEPTQINSTVSVSEIFVNPLEFIIKDSSNLFRITDSLSDYTSLSTITDAYSLSAKEDSGSKIMYSNNTKQLYSDANNLTCLNYDSTACSTDSNTLYTNAMDILKTKATSVSIYQGDVLANLPDIPKEIFESQQAINTWDLVDGNGNNSYVRCEYEQKDTNVTPFLRCGVKNQSKGNDARVEKTFSFGSDKANMIMQISLDMYEIDNWDNDRFYVKVNGQDITSSYLTNDSINPNSDDNNGTILSFNLADTDENASDELHKFSGVGQLDSNGDLHLEIGAVFTNEEFDDASFGLDNIIVRFYAKPITDEYDDDINILVNRKDFSCVVTQDNGNSKLYCWGQIDRSIPLLSTSLVNDDKISVLNNYFYDSSENILNQKTYDEYYNDGDVFLKYPTYIGGFDYDFKFR